MATDHWLRVRLSNFGSFGPDLTIICWSPWPPKTTSSSTVHCTKSHMSRKPVTDLPDANDMCIWGSFHESWLGVTVLGSDWTFVNKVFCCNTILLISFEYMSASSFDGIAEFWAATSGSTSSVNCSVVIPFAAVPATTPVEDAAVLAVPGVAVALAVPMVEPPMLAVPSLDLSAASWCNSERVMCIISRRWPFGIFSELKSSISTSFRASRDVKPRLIISSVAVLLTFCCLAYFIRKTKLSHDFFSQQDNDCRRSVLCCIFWGHCDSGVPDRLTKTSSQDWLLTKEAFRFYTISGAVKKAKKSCFHYTWGLHYITKKFPFLLFSHKLLVPLRYIENLENS